MTCVQEDTHKQTQSMAIQGRESYLVDFARKVGSRLRDQTSVSHALPALLQSSDYSLVHKQNVQSTVSSP